MPLVLLTTLIGHGLHLNEENKRFKDVPETLKGRFQPHQLSPTSHALHAQAV